MRWVRAVMGLNMLEGGWHVLHEAGYSPGSDVIIMPKHDANEALRLLREFCDKGHSIERETQAQAFLDRVDKQGEGK